MAPFFMMAGMGGSSCAAVTNRSPVIYLALDRFSTHRSRKTVPIV
jgi:hypothetical protein